MPGTKKNNYLDNNGNPALLEFLGVASLLLFEGNRIRVSLPTAHSIGWPIEE